jgi:DNA-binding LytR/AlgR family response regulator
MKTPKKHITTKHQILLGQANENIICLFANSNYTNIVFANEKPKLTAYNLAIYDNYLPNNFVRINRSCTVNTYFIKELNYHERTIILNNNTEIPISRRRWLLVKENLTR